MLPRFNSHENESLLPRFDDNQSAQTTSHPMKFLDRSGKRGCPLINTNIVNLDLEYTYEIVSNSLESYINYRKLNHCKALTNFIDYRDKIYKREKLGQFAVKQPVVIQEKVSPEHKQTPPTNTPEVSPIPSAESIISEKLSPSPVTSEEAVIPIPSPNLLRKPPIKQKRLVAPMKSQNNLKQIRSVNKDRSNSTNKKRKSKTKSCIIL